MDDFWKESVWRQFGAAIDALENALQMCPESLWGDNAKRVPFWLLTYHTLFWLDFYLSESTEKFAPPQPFGLEELDPSGARPPRTYTKDELQTYLEHCRKKCRETIAALTDERVRVTYKFGNVDLSFAELLFYNLRHVQHGAAQMNMILRRNIDNAPRWTFRAKIGLDGR